MRTDDELVETIGTALARFHAPVDDVVSAAIRDVPRARRRRRLIHVGAAALVAAAASAAVVFAGALTAGRDASPPPVTQPTTIQPPRSSPGVLDEAEMEAVLREVAPGHVFADLHTGLKKPRFIGDHDDGGRNSLQMWGTADGLFFMVFAERDSDYFDGPQLRGFVDCRDYRDDAISCEGGYQSYPDGTSRLMLQSTNDSGTAERTAENSASVFFPNGVDIGVKCANAPTERLTAPSADKPPFTIDELEQIASDPRWLAAMAD